MRVDMRSHLIAKQRSVSHCNRFTEKEKSTSGLALITHFYNVLFRFEEGTLTDSKTEENSETAHSGSGIYHWINISS